MSIQIEDESGASTDRRSILKKAAVLGAGVWAAPVITSITSPAAAGSHEPSTAGCIVLDGAARVSLTWLATACNTLAFGLVDGPTACTDCSRAGGGALDAGDYPAGATLRFWFEDHGFGSCCTFGYSCNGRYVCGSGTTHVAVQRESATTYKVYFVDAGCECGRVGQQAPPQAGPGARNIEVTVNLAPVRP